MKKIFRVLFFFFLGLFLLVNFFSSIEDTTTTLPPDDEFTLEDFDLYDTLNSEITATHYRVWRDANGEKRTMKFSVPTSANDESFHYRDTVKSPKVVTEKAFWNNFYFMLYDHDKGKLNVLQDSLTTLALRNGIQKNDLLYTTVSMIQDIKYNYILSADSCASHTDFPCVPLQRFGILSPVEFLYSLTGDCDTRTVLLFTLLKNLGYDPIIVNSYQYGHSMLAVDIPSEGDFFTHKGRKFYFWETTSTGWMPGMLPPDMANKDYWTIILDYEFQADPTRTY